MARTAHPAPRTAPTGPHAPSRPVDLPTSRQEPAADGGSPGTFSPAPASRPVSDLARTRGEAMALQPHPEPDTASRCGLARRLLAGATSTRPAAPVELLHEPAETVQETFDEWRLRARAAGHPVIAVRAGRFRPQRLPVWSISMPPNDLLDAAREYARSRVAWIHVEMPTLASLLTLAGAVHGPRPSGPARRPGGPTSVTFQQLVAEQHIGLSAVSDTLGGVTTHALDLPMAWMPCALRRVGPALSEADELGDPLADEATG